MVAVGGDLGAMSALAQRFGRAGDTFQTQSAAIAGRVDRALHEFVDQMRGLDNEARVLADEIHLEMTHLNGQAHSTTWTGTNRTTMDTAIAALDDDIVAIKAAIEHFMGEASSVVTGSLTSQMTELRSNTEASGARSLDIATGFSRSVEGQRASFDSVMNS
jgi:hypothetical protein